MKKIVLLFPFLLIFAFFYSFSSFSISDGCLVVLNSETAAPTFENLFLAEGDEAEKCNKNNALILNFPQKSRVENYRNPQNFSLDDFSFFAASVSPEKRDEDLFDEEANPALNKAESFEKEDDKTVFFPKGDEDIALFFIENDFEKESSNYEIRDLLFKIQSSTSAPTLFFLKNYNAERGDLLRKNSYLIDCEKSGVATIVVFSKIVSKNGEKTTIIRNINKRLFDY